MSTKEHWLQHRGRITALASDGTRLVFTTVHAEGRPTALYRLDPVSAALETCEVAGCVDLAGGDERWWLAGADGHVYSGPFGKLKAVTKVALDPSPVAVAPTTDGVAVLCGPQVRWLSAKGADIAQFELPAAGTAIAADPGGQWVVVGCSDGTVLVFSREEGDAWTALERAQLHQGSVTSLRFERDELRFRSAGTDNKFLVTHARGALDAIDRGGRHGHSGPVRGIAGDAELVYSAGEDGAIKAWARGQKRRPSSQGDGVGAAVGLAEITVDSAPQLCVACADGSLRLFGLGTDGKVGPRLQLFHGAMARLRHELTQNDPKRRSAALDQLAALDDAEAVALLAERARGDSDQKLRVHAVELLGRSSHPRAVSPLESLLQGKSAGVRLAALAGLRTQAGESDLRPLQLALEAGQSDVGGAAIAALQSLAAADDRCHAAIVGALDHSAEPVRTRALEALEVLHPKDAQASHHAFRSSHSSTRWEGALHLLQRGLLADDAVQRALRSLTEDSDATVRQLAYHLRLLTHPALVARLRYEDSDLHRNLHALETHGADKPGKPKKATKPKAAPETLSPVLQAASARRRDTCLRGAAHLAALGDDRALGVLLQLSREGESDIQVRACRALKDLADPRALGRLQAMLRLDDEQVRDAAGSALERLLKAEPIRSASIGLTAPHADIRRRGLRVLTRLLKSKLPKKLDDPAYGLLLQALNDVDAKLRGAAFKGALSLDVHGGGEGALRFVLGSLHTDIRREALTEIMSEVRHPWAWALLLERFDDPDAKLRNEAFSFARKKGKGRDPDAVVAALRSQWPDLRLQAIEVLSTKVDDRARPLLVEALDDDDDKVREQAFAAIRRAEDAEAIVAALGSRHPDVRIGAAASLAEQGQPQALEPLLEQVRSERPEVTDLAVAWQARVTTALQGLAWLGDAAATEAVLPLVHDDDAKLRGAAARTLTWVAPGGEVLLPLLQHTDDAVKRAAALGLAWRGDATGASLVFGVATPADQATAALGLSDDERLLALLDASDLDTRHLALRLVLLLEWAGTVFPERLLAALSAQAPSVRLSVAEVLEAWNDEALGEAVCAAVNGLGLSTPWPVPVDELRRLALALRYGAGLTPVVVAKVLETYPSAGRSGRRARKVRTDARSGSDKAAEGAELLVHRLALADQRLGGVLAGIADPGAPEAAALTDLVFGTYVGLGAQVASRRGEAVRAAALVRLGKLQGVDAEAVVDVLIPALLDGNGTVRVAAFEALQAAGMSPADTAAEALATGQRDLGRLALGVLAEGGGSDVLYEVMSTRTDGLETVALSLLAGREDPVAVATRALEARSDSARSRGVSLLEDRLSDHPETASSLHAALESRFADVRRDAALALGYHRDTAAFDALKGLLRDPVWADEALEALAELPDERVASALLDRIIDDPGGTASVDDLLSAVGERRQVDVVERLVAMLETHAEHADDVLDALRTISGYDQSLRFDADEPDADESWLEDQHPRHDAVFAQLLDHCAERKSTRKLRRLWRGATWARGSEVDAPLARMCHHAEERIRQEAVAALGWRLRFRGASGEALQGVLGHKDAVTAFLAAEGLARAGDASGISVLLASVETIEDVRMRGRAVLALGHLADPRALDPLLRIVEDDAHAVVEYAAEAIGHLSSTDAAADILKRLLQLSRGSGSVARRALVGLRFFGSPDAWARIREAAGASEGHVRAIAAELLRFDESDTRAESREVLVRLLLDDDAYRVAKAAGASLRRIDGLESLEPDYVFLQASFGSPEDDTVERLRERGDPARILHALASDRCDEDLVEPLLLSMLARDPLPLDAALAALADSRPRGPSLGARVLGRAAKLPKGTVSALATAADASLDEWLAARERGDDLDAAAERVRWTLWAAGRHGVGGEAVARALGVFGSDAHDVHRVATDAVALQAAPALLEQWVRVGDAEVRSQAAAVLARLDAKRAGALVGDVLDDRGVADRLLADPGVAPKPLGEAAAQVHLQGVVLPHLVARGQVAALQSALKSGEDGVRLGAVEALGAVGSEAAEGHLRTFASDEGQDEEERKAAWRALRRSKRLRAQQEAR